MATRQSLAMLLANSGVDHPAASESLYTQTVSLVGREVSANLPLLRVAPKFRTYIGYIYPGCLITKKELSENLLGAA